MLVDTSVWIDHFRRRNARLVSLLENGGVESHPFVIGELACGTLHRRTEILSLLEALPMTPSIEHEEALSFIDRHGLAGSGLGWIDVHLLASAAVARTKLWTADRRLGRAADVLHLGG